MRRLIPILAILALGVAAPCAAATAAKAPPPPKLRTVEVPKARQSGLPSKITPLAGQFIAPPPFASAPGLASMGLSTMRLGSADAGPACRAACASARYTAGSDDEGGSENWRQCVLGCGTSKP